MIVAKIDSTDFATWYAAKPSVAYSEPIILCSSVQELGQLASKHELRSEEVATVHAEEVATVHAEEVGTVHEEAEDEVASLR
jgi:hypothetical protein